MASTPKFNAKNLHYEKPEPAFLRRLRGEAAGGGDSDRLNVQHARTGKKPRLKMDDDDDGPTIAYEDEGGGNVGREEYEALTKPKGDGDGAAIGGEGKSGGEGGKGREDDGSGCAAVDGGEEREKQKVADVGGVKKRKAGKVVGGEEDADVEPAQMKGRVGARPMTTTTTTKSKSSRKQKKVKLSFDEPDS